MHALRKLSPRPTLFVDNRPGRVVDTNDNTLGRSGPLGRGRMVAALPLKDGPRQIVPPLVVHDTQMGYLADPDGNLIGASGLWINRLLDARWTEDTRRLGG